LYLFQYILTISDQTFFTESERIDQF
jgi:hypothetical protein